MNNATQLADALRAITGQLQPLRMGGLYLDDSHAAELTRDAREALAAYDAKPATQPGALADIARQLGQIVYTQNGNRHADITALLDQLRELLETPQPVDMSEALRDVLPYAESRIEDMQAADPGNVCIHAKRAAERFARAAALVDYPHADYWQGSADDVECPHCEKPATPQPVDALRAFVTLAESRERQLGGLSEEMAECLAQGRAALAEVNRAK